MVTPLRLFFRFLRAVLSSSFELSRLPASSACLLRLPVVVLEPLDFFDRTVLPVLAGFPVGFRAGWLCRYLYSSLLYLRTESVRRLIACDELSLSIS